MPEEPQVQTFTPEEEARYARWGLGVQGDGEPKPPVAAEPPRTEEQLPPATTEEEVDDLNEDEEPSQDEPQKPKKKTGVQRLREKHRAAEEARIRAEERAKFLEEQLAKSQTPPQEPTKDEPKPKPSKPDMATFQGTYEEYLEARDAWLLSQFQERQEAERKAEEAKTQEAKAKADQEAKSKTWAEKVEAAQARIPDLVQALNTPFATNPMKEAILRAENGVDVAYFLAKNKDEANRIAAMDPLSAALEIGRLDMRMKPAEPQRQAPPSTTSAPPPPNPVGARGVPTTDPSKLSDEEWLRQRYKRGR